MFQVTWQDFSAGWSAMRDTSCVREFSQHSWRGLLPYFQHITSLSFTTKKRQHAPSSSSRGSILQLERVFNTTAKDVLPFIVLFLNWVQQLDFTHWRNIIFQTFHWNKPRERHQDKARQSGIQEIWQSHYNEEWNSQPTCPLCSRNSWIFSGTSFELVRWAIESC